MNAPASCLPNVRRRVVVAALAVALALVAWLVALAPPAHAAQTVRLDGINTTLTAEATTLDLLFGLGIVPLPLGPATMALTSSSAKYTFPITGGQVIDSVPLGGAVNHSGGLAFARRNPNGTWTKYQVTKFVARLDAQADLTAVVNGDKRQSVAEVDRTYALTKRRTVKGRRYFTMTGATVTLNKDTTDAIEQTFGLTADTLPDELLLGTATLSAREKAKK